MNKLLQIVVVFTVLAAVMADSKPQRCRCSKLFLPVCGSDSRTYNNECELTCAKQTKSDLTLKHGGACAEVPEPSQPVGDNDLGVCICTKDFNPVCANNGRTYSNACEFRCAQKIRSELTISHVGTCDDVPSILVA